MAKIKNEICLKINTFFLVYGFSQRPHKNKKPCDPKHDHDLGTCDLLSLSHLIMLSWMVEKHCNFA